MPHAGLKMGGLALARELARTGARPAVEHGPPAARRLMARCWEARREDRPPSFTAVLAALADVLTEVQARPGE